MSQRCQSEKFGYATGKSALPSRTDVVRPVPLVRLVPGPDSCTAADDAQGQNGVAKH
jgi:hypothetical protein